jgi:hypothetical protein
MSSLSFNWFHSGGLVLSDCARGARKPRAARAARSSTINQQPKSPAGWPRHDVAMPGPVNHSGWRDARARSYQDGGRRNHDPSRRTDCRGRDHDRRTMHPHGSRHTDVHRNRRNTDAQGEEPVRLRRSCDGQRTRTYSEQKQFFHKDLLFIIRHEPLRFIRAASICSQGCAVCHE